MTQGKAGKCAHLPCGCEVIEPRIYCSEPCREAHEETGPDEEKSRECPCRHDSCCAESISLEDARALEEASAALAPV